MKLHRSAVHRSRSTGWTSFRLLGLVWLGLCFFVQASVALLVAVFAPSDYDKLADYMRLLEATVPFLAAAMGAYTFAPDNEPPIELLLTYPRPLWHTVLERSACMAAMLTVSSVAASLLFLTLTSEVGLNSLAQLAVVLGPPSFFVGALGLATTVYTARGTVGLLVSLIVCLAMAALPDELLVALPVLKWVYIFPVARYGTTWAGWSANRFTLTTLGALASIGALCFTRDSERLLRI